MGEAIALALAAEGAKVAVAGRRQEKLDAVAAQAEGNILTHTVDVAERESVKALFDWAGVQFGGQLHLLVNCACVNVPKRSMSELAPEDWDKVMAINARGTFLCVREMSRRRRKIPVEHGRVITVSSLAGEAGGLQSGTAYSASKAAVLGLTRTAARDLGPLGVTVNAIAPGPIDTPMLARSSTSGSYTMLDAVPLRRIGTPDEIAEAASFLASVGAGFVTGATIDVNGGLLMH